MSTQLRSQGSHFRRGYKINRNAALLFTSILWLFSLRFGFGQEIATNLLQDDFKIMRSALEEGHGGIYRYTTKADMDRTFASAYRKLNKPMTDVEFWRLVAPVVAQIKCGHTFLFLPQATQERIATKVPLLPLDVRVLDGRAWIYRDLQTP